MIRFSLHSPASPTEVVAALRARAGEWRESQIPDELRRAGILGVDCQICDAVGLLRYARITRDSGLELRATVTSDPTGGSLVDVRVAYRPVPFAFFVAAGGFAVAGAWLFAGSPLVVVPPLMAGALVAFNIVLVRQTNAALLSREREPAYLIERLERALAFGGVAPIRSPAS